MGGLIVVNKKHQCPYYNEIPKHNYYQMHQCPYLANAPMYNPNFWAQFSDQHTPFCDEEEHSNLIELKDYGANPFVVNISDATEQNNTFRTALWTGNHLQLTLMSIKVGEEIGLEIHPNVDQFLRIEEGQGIVKMGDRKDRLDFQRRVYDDFAIIIPAGKWHNVINTGNKPLKLYSIYAPPQHPKGTVHETKAIAEAAE